jgi:hypothetical protein
MILGLSEPSTVRPPSVGDAEQARHREPPDVGVEHADGVALRRERGRQVDGDGALADATLAAEIASTWHVAGIWVSGAF